MAYRLQNLQLPDIPDLSFDVFWHFSTIWLNKNSNFLCLKTYFDSLALENCYVIKFVNACCLLSKRKQHSGSLSCLFFSILQGYHYSQSREVFMDELCGTLSFCNLFATFLHILSEAHNGGWAGASARRRRSATHQVGDRSFIQTVFPKSKFVDTLQRVF